MLRQEIECLRAQLVDLRAAQDNDRAEAIKFILDVEKSIHQYIADIHDYLWPVIHKLFPTFAESKKQIDAFMKGRSAAGGDKRIS